ncbi:hypothetical protein [Nitrobacter hamburgensis]|uniref:hypothetical protein n=1 Tax=Nitrobacter hamburgensis TaxID=912 RepID=UPI0012EDF57E|nr:hypothetical protein [Nitrobacter hamburgensis]
MNQTIIATNIVANIRRSARFGSVHDANNRSTNLSVSPFRAWSASRPVKGRPAMLAGSSVVVKKLEMLGDTNEKPGIAWPSCVFAGCNGPFSASAHLPFRPGMNLVCRTSDALGQA